MQIEIRSNTASPRDIGKQLLPIFDLCICKNSQKTKQTTSNEICYFVLHKNTIVIISIFMS
jgi:hypothetical protein